MARAYTRSLHAPRPEHPRLRHRRPARPGVPGWIHRAHRRDGRRQVHPDRRAGAGARRAQRRRHGARRQCARAEISAEFSLEDGCLRRRPGSRPTIFPTSPVCACCAACWSRAVALAPTSMGGPSTLQQLKELGEMLVDIHGQHEHQSLLRPAAQRELLDAYAGATALGARGRADLARMAGVAAPARWSGRRTPQAIAAEREQLRVAGAGT